MKPEERNYMADIERYFLGFAGKGLMLSARDYGFIRELGERSVSREMAIKAIAYGFEKRKKSGVREPRGIFDIRQEIEEYLKTRSAEEQPGSGAQRHEAGFAGSGIIEQALRSLDGIIIEEKREKIRERYEELRRKVLDSQGSGNMYRRLDSLWQDFLEGVFSDLSAEERERITVSARNRLPADAKLYDEDAREKTFRAFRDEIVCGTLEIDNVFMTK